MSWSALQVLHAIIATRETTVAMGWIVKSRTLNSALDKSLEWQRNTCLQWCKVLIYLVKILDWTLSHTRTCTHTHTYRHNTHIHTLTHLHMFVYCPSKATSNSVGTLQPRCNYRAKILIHTYQLPGAHSIDWTRAMWREQTAQALIHLQPWSCIFRVHMSQHELLNYLNNGAIVRVSLR